MEKNLEMKEIESAMEGILFASGEPVAIDRICLALDIDRATAELVLQKLSDYYAYERRGIRLVRMEESYQLCSAPEYADVIRRAFEIRKPAKLSQPALEVLAIIAYYQPTTRAYVDQVRGVDSSYTVGLLLDRHLIEECGRLQVPGRPRLYRTTKAFLRAFHLNSLEDLPEMPGLETDGQLRIAEPDGAAQPEEYSPFHRTQRGGEPLKALWIIGGILLLLVLLSLVRVGAVLSFGEELRVRLRLGPAKLTLLPRPPKKDRPKREKKPKKQPTDGEKKPKKKAPSITALDILDALPALFESLKAGLRKTRRRLRIDPLRIAVVLGGDDPADVGELYGMVSAAMYTVMPQLERLTYMPDPRIHLEADFTAAQTLAEGTVGLQLRDLFAIGWAFGRPLLRWFLHFRKNSAARAAQTPKTDSADAQPSEEKAAS